MPADRPDGESRDPDLTRTAQPAGRDGDAAARLWGDLRLLDEIGRGGFGRVYRAWDESLAREVALKIIKHEDARHRSAVVREGQMLARVKHRGVVTIYRAQQIGDEVGLTMELIRGRTLAEVVRQGGPMSAEEAAVVGMHLCHALAAVHGAGLLHRDVKAQNVMREAGGRIVLMDFGAGREFGQWEMRAVAGTELSGTPLYLAPELFDGQPASPASDLYSLGVLLFYLVTRRYPVEGASLAELGQQHAAGRHHLLSDLRPDAPDAFARVVHRALARRPEQRSPSAGAMVADLADAMPGTARRLSDAAVETPAVRDPGWTGGPGEPDARVAGVEALRQLTPAVRAVVAAAGAVMVCGLLGLLTSAHYNRALGRDAGFSDDTIWTWLEMGVRSLVPPAIYLVVLLVAARVIAAVWHFVQRLVPPARRATDSARSGLSRTIGRLTRQDGLSVTEGLLIAQVAAVLAVAWGYRSLIATFPLTVNDADPGALAVLDPSPANAVLYSYGPVTALLLAAMAFSWRWLYTRWTRRAAIPRATVAGAVGVMLLVLLLIEVPFRLLYQSEAPLATYDGQPCYVTGERADERLLYCPGAPKGRRTPVVKHGDLRAVDAQPGRLFAPPPTGEHR